MANPMGIQLRRSGSPWLQVVSLLPLLGLSSAAFPGTSATFAATNGSTQSWLAARVAAVQPTEIQFDRSGAIWLWKSRNGEVQVYSGGGELKASAAAPGAKAVAVDLEWGVAALDQSDTLVVRDWKGEAAAKMPLDGQHADVAWLSAHELAVTPKTGTVRVVVVDPWRGVVVRRFGSAVGPPPGPGLIQLRHDLVRFDEAQRHLWVLDSTSGAIALFNPSGDVLHQTTLGNSDAPGFEQWAARLDAQARAAGKRKEVTMHQWPSVAMDRRGSLWTVKSCSQDGHGATVVGVTTPTSSPAETRLTGLSCCARHLFVQGNDALIYSVPGKGAESTTACIQERGLQ